MVGYGEIWHEYAVRELVFCWCVWQEYDFSNRQYVPIIKYILQILYIHCDFQS